MPTEPRHMMQFATFIDDETGAPRMHIRVNEIDDNDEVTEHIVTVDWSAYSARLFALDMMMHTFDVEAASTLISGMRAHKIPENEIEDIFDEANTIKHARRVTGT